MFYLNQLGYNRAGLGPQQFALQADKEFGTNFASFSNVYQKAKYSQLLLTENEQQPGAEFLSGIHPKGGQPGSF